MSKLFQIHEDDLADLERIVPQWTQSLGFESGSSPELRTQIRRIQKIITDVRWNYQPHTEIERIDASPEIEGPT